MNQLVSDTAAETRRAVGAAGVAGTPAPGAPGTAAAGVPAPRVHADALYPSPLAAGARLQEFEISAVIGQGGFGIVYLARDLSLQRSVAIKEYMPAHLAGRNAEGMVRPLIASQAEVFELGRRSFINEARMLARFKHPGLLEVLRFWEQNGTAYMAMPYYDGATLTQYLKRHPKVATEAWLKKTLRPLVDALGHMHDEDCFHRDVAPDNILILKDGSAVLLDLGAARRVIANDAQAMTVMLKPGYAPIEQYSDDPRFRQGPWTDIYAVAAVFFFAITGKPPPASASRVMRDSVPPLSSVRPAGYSESFLQAIDQGLSLQPEDRPRSIVEFRSLLYATPSDSGSASLPASTLLHPSKPTAQAQARPAAKPGAGATQRAGADAADDPFAPPAPSRVPLLVAAVAGVLTLAAAGTWYVLRPEAAPEAAGARIEAQTETALAAPGTTPVGGERPVAKPATAAPEVAAQAAVAQASVEATARDPAAAQPLVMSAAEVKPTMGAPATATPATATPATAAPATATPAAVQPATVQPTAVQPTIAPTSAARPVPVERPSVAVGAAPAPAAPAPANPAADAEAPARPAATGSGTVVLAVKPWAEIRVNGVTRGNSPPLKQLTLPAGRHTIELRNPAAAPVRQQIEVRANQRAVVKHQF